jgi:hypothetical protein
MSSEFSDEYFTPCVKEFVSTVLCIDDQLDYESDTQNAEILTIPTQGTDISVRENLENNLTEKKKNIYAPDLIKAFSEKKILITPLNPNDLKPGNRSSCETVILSIAQKADVIIFDWELEIKFSDGTSVSDETISKNIIKKLINDDRYHLIIIYTWEQEATIRAMLPSDFNGKDIKIYGKAGSIGTDVRTYPELAESIVNDYLSDKKGLLAGALISDLSDLRNATSKMLNRLKPEFNLGVIIHCILLSESNKTGDFISEIIRNEILSQLSDDRCNENKVDYSSLECIQKYYNEMQNGKIEIKGENITDENFINLLEKKGNFKIKDIQKEFLKPCHENDMASFSYYTMMQNKMEHMNLKLGCIVKKGTTYLLCIQPLCDTERIQTPKQIYEKNTEPREFLFLQLEETSSKIDFYVDDNGYKGLSVKYTNYKTYKFVGDEKGLVSMEKKYFQIFPRCSKEPTLLEYIDCLKPMIAQKILNEFAAHVSRVGIDQFEWLRLKGRP